MSLINILNTNRLCNNGRIANVVQVITSARKTDFDLTMLWTTVIDTTERRRMCLSVKYYEEPELLQHADWNMAGILLLMSHHKQGFWSRRWGTYHFWEIHICGADSISVFGTQKITFRLNSGFFQARNRFLKTHFQSLGLWPSPSLI